MMNLSIAAQFINVSDLFLLQGAYRGGIDILFRRLAGTVATRWEFGICLRALLTWRARRLFRRSKQLPGY